MTPEQLSSKVESTIENADIAFGKTVSKTQKELFSQMQSLLSRLELNPDGTIKQNQNNRKLLARVDEYFNRAFNESGYYNQLNGFNDTIIQLTDSNQAYFEFVKESFSANAQYLKSLQRDAITSIESLLANEGLEAQLKTPLIDILNQNINTGASFSDLLKQVREFTLGTDELQGQLQRYSRQIVNDTLFNFNRAYQEAISEQAGLEWYYYSGNLDRDSRDFCKARVGKYFRKSDVEKWPSRDWTGKRRGTTSSTIFIYAGGYNCRHMLIAVSEAVVPNKYKKPR